MLKMLLQLADADPSRCTASQYPSANREMDMHLMATQICSRAGLEDLMLICTPGSTQYVEAAHTPVMLVWLASG